MLYAEVIVANRTNTQELTYAVSAQIVPYIRLGSLVTVPLRRKKIRGVVVALRRSVSTSIKSKIREIIEIDRDISVSSSSIEVVRQLSEYYGASLAEVAYHALRTIAPQPKANIPHKKSLPIYIQASWQLRCKYYVGLIKKFSGNVLLIFSQQEYLLSFERKLSLLPTNLQKKCTLVTQTGAFSQLPESSMIIVDQPYHVGGKSMRRPFMTTRTIAIVRSKFEGHQLVLADSILGFQEVVEISQQRAKLISATPDPIEFSVSKQTIRQGIGERALEQIRSHIYQQQSVAVLCPSTSWAPALFCTDCQKTIECPQCFRPIGAATPTSIHCRNCGYQQDWNGLCLYCHKQTVVEVGVGVKQLQKKLEQALADMSVEVVESEEFEYGTPSKILVSTEKFFSSPERAFDLVVLVGWDRLISGVMAEGNWRLLGYLTELQGLARSIIVETLFTEHECWGNVTPSRLRNYFTKELGERRRLHLPPYGQVVSIVGHGKTQPLERELNELLKGIEKLGYTTLPYFPQRRGKSVVASLSVFSPKKLSSREKTAIRELLRPSWHLDIDVLN